MMPPPPPPPDVTLQAMAVAAATVPPVTQADMPAVTQIVMPPFPVRDGNPSLPPSPWQHLPPTLPAAATSHHEVATSTTVLAAAHTATPLDEATATALPRGIPFNPSDYPELQIDYTTAATAATRNNHSNLVRVSRTALSKRPIPRTCQCLQSSECVSIGTRSHQTTKETNIARIA